MKNKKTLILVLVLVILAVVAMWSNVSLNKSAFPIFKGNFSSHYGIILMLFLVFINGILLNNYLYSAIAGFVTSSIGIYFKINYYILPEFKKEESLIKFKEAFFPYLDFLKSYYFLIIFTAILMGLAGTLIAKIGIQFNAKRKEEKAKKNYKNKFLDARMMAYISVFVALSVVVNILRVGSLSFGGFPIIFSGFILGPIGGFIVGAITDILSFIIRPSGQFNILFTLTSALTGFIPIVVFRLLSFKNDNLSFWKVFIGVATGQLITSVILVPIFLALFMGTDKGFAYFAIKALIKQSLSVPIYSIVLISLYESLIRSGIKLEKAN